MVPWTPVEEIIRASNRTQEETHERSAMSFFAEAIWPFRPGVVNSYVTQDSKTGDYEIEIEVPSWSFLPSYRTKISRQELMETSFTDFSGLYSKIAVQAGRYFSEFYIQPEENIVLGEN